MDFFPNFSFNSIVVPPTIECVKLKKMSKQMMPIKCVVKCDTIVKNNLIDLTSKNSSNPILNKKNSN
jgi:hypothetical protein